MHWLTGSRLARASDQSVAAGPPDQPSLHFIDGQGLLLDAQAQRLYRLNAAAAVVWSLVEEGGSADAIARRLAAEHGIAADEAARLVEQVLRQWRAERSAPAPAGRPVRFAAVQAAAAVESYALGSARFRVSFDSAQLRDALHPLLQGWTPRASANPPLEVTVVCAGERVEIGALGWRIGAAPAAAAAVALRAALTQLAVETSGGLCAVHAGALATPGGALLLPGNAGRGKSTLSAGLAASGLPMVADDTTLLAGDPPLAVPVPTGLCVKRGAYPVLGSLFPALAALPEWSRPDGLVAKYLRPGIDLGWAVGAVPVRWLVFPHYDPAHRTRLVPLPRAAALERLLSGVYFLSGTLDAANLDALIGWLAGVDCYELPLGSLDEAVAAVRELCG